MIRTLITTFAIPVLAQAITLPALLDVAAKSAKKEIAALSAVACTETVVETKINAKDKNEERRRQTFDYLVLVDTEDGEMAITESRVEQGKSKTETAKPLLASSGFSTLLLILHPYYQSSFEFTDLGTLDEGGRGWRRLGFEFLPGKRSPSILRTGTREFPLAWKGEILLDEPTGQVLRVHASLGSQLVEIGLASLEANVRYGADGLPQEAVIELKTAHQHWRNVHTFAGYKKFGVGTSEKVEVPKQP